LRAATSPRNKLQAHQPGKPINGDGVDLDGKRTGFPGVIGGFHGPVTGDSSDTFFETWIGSFDGSRLHGRVKAPKTFFCIAGLARKIYDPAVGRGLPFVPARFKGELRAPVGPIGRAERPRPAFR